MKITINKDMINDGIIYRAIGKYAIDIIVTIEVIINDIVSTMRYVINLSFSWYFI